MDFDQKMAEALDELVLEGKLVPGTSAHGVAMKYLHEGGDQNMSQSQRAVLNSSVVPLLKTKSCQVCGEFGAYADGKRLCEYHRSQTEKADKDD